MTQQLWAAVAVGVVVLAAAGLEWWRSTAARRRAIGAAASPANEPYIIYFTGDSCAVCRTHQDPAIARLGAIRVDKVDALADRELADRFHVYMLPTTVVMSPQGRALHVNYGYAPAPKLERQLTEARGEATLGSAATA